MPPRGWKKQKDPEPVAPPVVETTVTPAGVSEAPVPVAPVAPPPPPPPPPPPAPVLSEDEKCRAQVQAVADLKKAWLDTEEWMKEHKDRSAEQKRLYEERRSSLGQKELDWARTYGWVGLI